VTLEEHLVDQFYRWEIRGRGWQVWDAPVRLEPPFRAFFGHTLPWRSGAQLDDARKPTRLGRWIERLRGVGPPTSDVENVSEDEPAPDDDLAAGDIVEHTITLPDDLKVTKERAERFLLGLSPLEHPLSFEIIGRAGAVRITLACHASDSPEVRRALGAYFPEAGIVGQGEPLPDLWRGVESAAGLVVDFGLSREFMLPLKTVRDFDVDPLISVVAALGDLRDDEIGILQVLVQATRNPWAPSILRAVTDGEGDCFFSDAPDILSQASEKIAHPLFAAIVRVAARCPERERSWSIVRTLGGSPYGGGPAAFPVARDAVRGIGGTWLG